MLYDLRAPRTHSVTFGTVNPDMNIADTSNCSQLSRLAHLNVSCWVAVAAELTPEYPINIHGSAARGFYSLVYVDTLDRAAYRRVVEV